ncbi:hypothetical protein M422DRAFT_48735 [Sphaerobolus stellatus SS14]|uniref:Small ribosomal subunit protein mS38 n=1 Tax=Sphaerobolus stellatus (strain SS14) TaxID=990650 RepID=A0A0C9VT54_SPHS4|nr:hypothetical protein M422DRAFT_48735 [Sphaerobolus stellatus SS14]
MLTRVFPFPPLSLRASRRAYSVFSSKPGGGRYFNSAKPHKVAPATAHAAKPSDDPAPEDAALSVEESSNTTPLPPSPSLSPPLPTPRAPLHPSFSAQTYPLHQFFALHRPLLQLSLPSTTFFETPSISFDQPLPPPSSQQQLHIQPTTTYQTPFAGTSESSDVEQNPDADADAARQLARAIALNRVSSTVDWRETLARLGDKESIEMLMIPVDSIDMDSTKRKRKRKMSKHKYKKRRRATRAERKKLGK